MDTFSLFKAINVRKVNESYSLYKPLLLIHALSKCYAGEKRLIEFSKIEFALNDIANKFTKHLEHRNFHYAFGRLENDGIWEIENSKELGRSNSGDLIKSELLIKMVRGGFTCEIYKELYSDKELLLCIAKNLLNSYFPVNIHKTLFSALGLPEETDQIKPMMVCDVSFESQYNKTIIAVNHTRKDIMETQQNGYIAYLNSLHNVTASGANALAESQALNRYFTELYEPFPLIAALHNMLLDKQERVILLTGHAGDGKSTIALDVLKRLRNLPENECLITALKEQEELPQLKPPVFIVKDMSELTAQQRLDSLAQGFNQPGNWLIVSNTGPLINSLADFREAFGGPDSIESNILELLDKPYRDGDLNKHILRGFSKELVIVNITRLDNVAIGARVLTRMVKHSAWANCNGCDIEARCPLRLNQTALQDINATVEERVRWVYQYLTAYEQRLTLRQMVAHLALSMTGGMSCEEAKALVKSSSESATPDIAGLGRILFSESFFGYRAGKSWPDAEGLRAIALIRRSVFGGPIAVDFERHLLITGGCDGLNIPQVLTGVQQNWRQHATEASGVRWRFALRRMLYLFGQQASTDSAHSDSFLRLFLQSPQLKDFDYWQNQQRFLDESDQRKLTQRCLQVLLEIYSGFSSGQLQHHDCLYLTLRRPNGAAIQPTQLVVAKLDNHDFSLRYDRSLRLPLLSYQNGKVELKLTLPLLDYFHARSIGDLGNGLAPIHLAQLDWFRAELLKITRPNSSEEISLLRSGINGNVQLYRYIVDKHKQRLEQYS